MDDRVSVSISDGVADVRLVRADKMNALDAAMFDALVGASDRLAREKGVRAVVLSGEGRAFCAGLDMGRFAAMKDQGGNGIAGGERRDLAARTPAFEVAREIAGKSPEAIRAAKRMLNNLAADPGPALLAESIEQMKLMGGANQLEAVRANMEKRAPRFADV